MGPGPGVVTVCYFDSHVSVVLFWAGPNPYVSRLAASSLLAFARMVARGLEAGHSLFEKIEKTPLSGMDGWQ